MACGPGRRPDCRINYLPVAEKNRGRGCSPRNWPFGPLICPAHRSALLPPQQDYGYRRGFKPAQSNIPVLFGSGRKLGRHVTRPQLVIAVCHCHNSKWENCHHPRLVHAARGASRGRFHSLFCKNCAVSSRCFQPMECYFTVPYRPTMPPSPLPRCLAAISPPAY
jgi:hypothetical protein